jgi:putative N6-adenine-specific DNA methylase
VCVAKPIRGGVTFEGPLDAIYHANLELRTAHRVLLRIADFLAQSYPMLYGRARRLPWELYIGFESSFSLSVTAKASRLRHHKNIEATIGDAVSSALEPLSLSPILAREAVLPFQVRLFRDRCTLSFNTSGDHLHRRGYRTHVSEAPLRETLAAGVAIAGKVEACDLIVDPFCGSGTLLIESALYLIDRPPGLGRDHAFMRAPYFQESKWQRFKREASSRVRNGDPARLIGFDLSAEALRAAKHNSASAGLLERIAFKVADARDIRYRDLRMNARRPLLLSNLPYGDRLGSEAGARGLITEFCNNILKNCQGWEYALITRHPSVMREVGLQPRTTLPFRNGGLEVVLVRGKVP